MKYLVVILALLLNGCSGCSSNGSAKDAGSDTGTSGDTDTDTDSDTDSDTDTGTTPEGFVADAGPWEWTDLPDSGDCGVVGCRQLTFVDEVRMLEWDVWGNLLTFNSDDDHNIRIVDHAQGKVLIMPNAYPDIGIGPAMGSGTLFPATIYDKTVCYTRAVFQDPDFSDIICADLDAEMQKHVYHRPKEGDDFPNPAKYIDIYGDRIVSEGGCGDVMDSWPLCVFDMSNPGSYDIAAPDGYGWHNSMWGDIVVWYGESSSGMGLNIEGYDFSTQQFVQIADETGDQMFPRIHGDRVVYQDLRFGTSDGAGDWNHSAVFMYEISTSVTTQITSGAWIAAYPDVYDNIIIWADYRDSANPNDKNSLSGVEIWGYNIDTTTEFKITNLPGRVKTTPRIWGDKVFVAMYKATSGDAIYMFDLP